MMAITRWLEHGKRVPKRTDDGRGDVPVPEDYSTDTLPLSSEPSNTCLQAWERMAVRSFGSGAMDPRADQTPTRLMKESWH